MTMTTVAPANAVAAGTPSPVDTEARGLELIDIHRRAGHLVAELSAGPAWIDADRITCRLIAEAQAVATLTASADAVAAPAVVRCRELAAAQRRMVLALERGERFDVDESAVVRARALLAELAELVAGQRATLRR